MAVPTLLDKADHIHISEREADGSWEDCTWDAGLEWYRVTRDKSKPATHAEAQELRKASGKPPTGGSNQWDFRRGVKARYKVDLDLPISGFAALWAALEPGNAASVQGSMKAFGPTHPLSRYDRNFDGAHDVFVARTDATDTVWWCDPEAPNPAGPSYQGERVSKADLKRFVDAFNGEHLIGRLTSAPKESDMPALTTYLPGFTADIKPESNVRAEPSGTATKLRTTPKTPVEPVVLTGTVKGSVDPGNGSDVWYTWWKNGRWEYTAKDNILNIKNPAAQPPVVIDCATQVKTAVDAAIAAAKVHEEAAVATAVADATRIENERIANAEADRIRNL